MPEKKQVEQRAIKKKAGLCLDCSYKTDLNVTVPRMGLLRVKPENVAVRVDCVIAGDGAKPCSTQERRERRIAHYQNKPAFAV